MLWLLPFPQRFLSPHVLVVPSPRPGVANPRVSSAPSSRSPSWCPCTTVTRQQALSRGGGGQCLAGPLANLECMLRTGSC